MTTKKDTKKDKDESRFSDVLKKVVGTGIGAAFMTEDAIRKSLADLPIPSEVLQNFLKNAGQSKKEITQGLKREFGAYLEKINLTGEIEKILENYNFEVQAKFQFKKRKDREDDPKK